MSCQKPQTLDLTEKQRTHLEKLVAKTGDPVLSELIVAHELALRHEEIIQAARNYLSKKAEERNKEEREAVEAILSELPATKPFMGWWFIMESRENKERAALGLEPLTDFVIGKND